MLTNCAKAKVGNNADSTNEGSGTSLYWTLYPQLLTGGKSKFHTSARLKVNTKGFSAVCQNKVVVLRESVSAVICVAS